MAHLNPVAANTTAGGTLTAQSGPPRSFDLATTSLRELNHFLHRRARAEGVTRISVSHPDGAHSIACGLDAALEVEIHGHVGYYVGGMNQSATVIVNGNAGPGAGENMMSGRVHIRGFASTAAGASAHGGLLVIDGDAFAGGKFAFSVLALLAILTTSGFGSSMAAAEFVDRSG